MTGLAFDDYRRRVPVRWVAAGALVFGLASCGSDGDRYASVGDALDGGSRDGALADGALPGDDGGGALDATVLPDGRVVTGPGGGGGGGGGGDGDGDGDGDDADGGFVSEIDVSSCGLSEDETFELSVPFVDGGFALAPGDIGFGLAFQSEGACRHVIETVPVMSTGPFLTPTSIVDDCRTIRELSLVKAVEGWYMAWTDNSTNRIELHSMRLNDDLTVSADTQRSTLTDNQLFERRPVLTRVGDSSLLAWFSEGDNDEHSLWTKVIGSSADARQVVAASAGHRPIELAMAELGPDRAVMAWVDEIANKGIWLQRLDAEGAAVGPPERMTDYAAPGSTVDVTTRERDGGATVYSVGIDLVNFEVRFRRMALDASFRGEEIKVISRPLQGKDAGLARVGGGYAVVYRAIPDGNVIEEPQIRLAFVTREGNLTRDAAGRVVTYPIAPATRDGSRIQVKLSVDGQLLIAFVDGHSEADNTLRLIRRRLDCALER